MTDTTLTPEELHVARQAARDGDDADVGPSTAPEAVTPLSGPDTAPGDAPAPVTRFAIVGYTPTMTEALPLLDDPTWAVWGMNNLHAQPAVAGMASKFDEWFDLHPAGSIVQDQQHAEWLARGSDGVPVWTWEPKPEWPNAKRYPREEITARFGRYFTNTVSWQVALALLRIMAHSPDGARAPAGSAIAIFGVDMATSSEYAAQRPSVEYFLGIAAGAGVEVILPERSDLLKCAQLYGETDGGFRAMLDERREILSKQLAEHEGLVAQHQANVHALRGALEQVNYISGVWTQPNIDRSAPQNQPSQDGSAAPS